MTNSINRAEASLTYILWLLIFWCGNAPIFKDADSAWHLATGNLIRATYNLPITDPWSFTAAGAPWYNLSWAFDILISYLNTQSLIYIFPLIITAMAAAIVSFSLSDKISPVALLITLFIHVWVAFSGVLLRPEIITLLFSAIAYRRLSRLTSFDPALVLLMFLWVNLHGGFLILYMLFAVFIFEAWLNKSPLAPLLLTFLACVATSFANPYGIHIYQATQLTFGSALGGVITEWQPVQFGQHWVMTFYAIFFLLVSLPSAPIRTVDKLLAYGTLFAALFSIRYSHLLALLAIPYVSGCLSIHLARFPHLATRYVTDLQKPLVANTLLTVCAILTLFLSFASSSNFEPHLPKDAMQYLRDHHPNAHFLNDYNLGGYMILEGNGNPLTFIDGRADTSYPKSVLKDYVTFLTQAGWGKDSDAIIKKYNLKGMVLPPDTPDLNHFLTHKDWKIAYQDNQALIILFTP